MCLRCGVNPAIAGDGDEVCCRFCIWRLSQIAFEPNHFAYTELVAVATAHRDIVRFVVVTGGSARWDWLPEWPGRKDMTAVKDAPVAD